MFKIYLNILFDFNNFFPLLDKKFFQIDNFFTNILEININFYKKI